MRKAATKNKKNKEIDDQWLCPSPWERGQGERSVFQRSKN
jgi:hypothetical protein